MLVGLAVIASCTPGAFAQAARSLVVPYENEPPPTLTIEPPLPGPLAKGVSPSFRIASKTCASCRWSASASELSPRVGHVHVTVDDLPSAVGRLWPERHHHPGQSAARGTQSPHRGGGSGRKVAHLEEHSLRRPRQVDPQNFFAAISHPHHQERPPCAAVFAAPPSFRLIAAAMAMAACTPQAPAPKIELHTGFRADPAGHPGRDTHRDAGPGPVHADMPQIAPIGVRIEQAPERTRVRTRTGGRSSQGLPAAGPRRRAVRASPTTLTSRCSSFTTRAWWSSIAPPSFSAHIPAAIAEVTKNLVTHLCTATRTRTDIGGTRALGGKPVIIAQEETLRLLKRDNDPDLATANGDLQGRLHTWKSAARSWSCPITAMGMSRRRYLHQRARASKVLMVVDVVFPRLDAMAPVRRRPGRVRLDRAGRQDQLDGVDTFVGGHVERTGTHADVQQQAEFYKDLRDAAAKALSTTKPGRGRQPQGQGQCLGGLRRLHRPCRRPMR